VHEMPDFVVLAFLEPAHPAMFAMLSPQVPVDVVVSIGRSDKSIPVLGPSRGKLSGPGEVEPNALEHTRQLGHDSAPRIDGPRSVSTMRLEKWTTVIRRITDEPQRR
jgi:hypothetical protein